MSQETRKAAEEVQEQLGAAEYHLKRAGEKVLRVPDKDLQRKIKGATEKFNTAKEHVDKSLEGK